jgi:hypothetical protein
MPRATVKLSPSPEAPPDWWAEQFHHRQQRARLLILRTLGKAGRPMSSSEVFNYTAHLSRREANHAMDALIASGEVRRFVWREPFTTAFGVKGNMVDRTYYELTEQA